jgi:hypothetical protein
VPGKLVCLDLAILFVANGDGWESAWCPLEHIFQSPAGFVRWHGNGSRSRGACRLSERPTDPKVNGIRVQHSGNRPKSLAAAFCALMLALPPWTTAAAQNYAGRSWATEDAAGERAAEADLFSMAGTRDSSAGSTWEMPTVTRAVAGEKGSAWTAPPPSVASAHCAGCDHDPDTPVGGAQIQADASGHEAYDSEFDADEVETSWLGLSLSRDRRKLKSGGYASGLVIIAVQANSPAAKAGLQPLLEGKVRTAAEIATLGAGMVFPPAMVGVAIIRSIQLDESYDMIIGVDGDRITNIADFEDHLRIVQPGQIVYLNIVRNGMRLQVPVSIPQETGTRYDANFTDPD